MVDTRMQVRPPRSGSGQTQPEPAAAPEHPPQHQRRFKRLQRLKDARPEVKLLNVIPTNDAHRPVLKHPTGVKFKETGSAAWPDDNFTHRRLRDGSVKLAEETKKETNK